MQLFSTRLLTHKDGFTSMQLLLGTSYPRQIFPNSTGHFAALRGKFSEYSN